jgi:ABC-type antimicrobial peptide transport system permease subunit
MAVVYRPLSETDGMPRSFNLRVADSSSGLAPAIRQTVKEVNPRLEPGALRTMGEVADATLLQERLIAQLASFFSAFALFLTCIGLFGVVSYTVTHRTREIGVRMALGARVFDVLRMILREALVMTGIGVAIGTTGALALTDTVRSLLFGIEPNDPTTLLAAVVLIALAAGFAAYLPARRASRVDPIAALRYE